MAQQPNRAVTRPITDCISNNNNCGYMIINKQKKIDCHIPTTFIIQENDFFLI